MLSVGVSFAENVPVVFVVDLYTAIDQKAYPQLIDSPDGFLFFVSLELADEEDGLAQVPFDPFEEGVVEGQFKHYLLPHDLLHHFVGGLLQFLQPMDAPHQALVLRTELLVVGLVFLPAFAFVIDHIVIDTIVIDPLQLIIAVFT